MTEIAQLLSLFSSAVLAGVMFSVVFPVLGVFSILKRAVFVGVTLSETAACGVAAALAMNLPPYAGAGAFTLAAVALLALPFEGSRIPRDAVLGVVFVAASSAAVLLVAGSGFGLHEVKAMLYGDLILTSTADLAVIAAVLLPALAACLLGLRPILYSFLDRDAARVLGISVAGWEFFYFFALGAAVSAGSKAAGAILIFCYLVVTPAGALLLSRNLKTVMALAVGAALLSTLFGLAVALTWDLPANQTVAATACIFFLLAAIPGLLGGIALRRSDAFGAGDA